MTRQRKTWKQAEVDKTASPPPQTPAVDRTEGPDHPAYHEDPDKDKYKSGDTSAWAEDPHKPRSPETPPPAMPGNLTTEDLEHPGTSEFQKTPQTPEKASDAGGGGGKQAAETPSLKKMAEMRASLCVKIAAAMMPGADAAAVEDKALELMDLDDAQLRATANTLKVLAGEEEEEEEEITEIEAGKKANLEITARLDKLEASMGKLVEAMTHFFGGEGDEEGMTDKELMAYLMAEDTDGDGVDQNAPDYGYSGKSSGEEEPILEETEVTEVEAKEAQEEDEEEAMLRAMLEEMDEEMATTASTKTAQEEEEEKEEEEKEGGKKAAENKDASAVQDATEPLAKGPSVQSGEGGNVNPDEYPPTPRVSQSDGSEVEADPTPHGKSKTAEDTGVAENDIEITAGVDPLGLMSEETKEASADDELAQLYADLELPKTAQEEAPPAPAEGEGPAEMEEAEEEAKEEGEEESPTASKKKKAEEEPKLKPQQKAASTGAQKLGNVAGQTKTAASEVSELQKLWESAPDVSQIFGVPSSK